jgi:hypothetical protein
MLQLPARMKTIHAGYWQFLSGAATIEAGKNAAR